VAQLGIGPGCSWFFVDRAPVDHAHRRYFDCTSTYAPAVGDAVIGGLVVAGVLGASAESSTDSQETVEGTAMAAALLASAAVGFMWVHECREAKQDLARRILEPGPFPPVGPSPPGGARDPWLAAGPPPGTPAVPISRQPADAGVQGGGADARLPAERDVPQ